MGYGNVSVINRADKSVSGAQNGISANSSVNGNASPSDVSITVEANSSPTAAAVTASSLMGLAAINANNLSGGNITIITGANDRFISGGTGINAGSGAANVASGKQISVTTSTGTISSGYNFFSGGGTPSGISAGYFNGSPANVHGNVVLNNASSVTAASGPGINLFNNGNGTISATLQAASQVNAKQGIGLTAFSAAGASITINNQGTINAAGIGISANNGSGNSVNGLISISNSGTITAPGAPFIPVIAIGNGNSTQTATLSNAALASIVSSLFARTTNNTAISFNGNGSVTNSGTITGNISFSGSASGSFTNATVGSIWNINGSNFFGGGTNVISNAGLINMFGLAAFFGASAITLSNTGSIAVMPYSSAQVFASVTGVGGAINMGDRSALELGFSVASTQTINLTGRGLLTLDNPASVAAPVNFNPDPGKSNIGSVITLQGANFTGPTIPVSSFNTSGANSFIATGAGLSGNMFDVLTANRLVLVPNVGAGTTMVTGVFGPTTINSPVAPVNGYSVYVLDGATISGNTGSGYNINTTDTVATNTYALVVNANSSVSVTGPVTNSGLRVGTSGASGAIINAATLSGSDFGINVNLTNVPSSGSGNADVVDYGNVTGGQSAIQALSWDGNVNVNVVFGPSSTLTGNTAFGIVANAGGGGGVSVMMSGGTISAGTSGISAIARQKTTFNSSSVQVYNSANITSGNNGAANVLGAGVSGIRAGILNDNTSSNPNSPNLAITGNAIIESRGSITAKFGDGLHAFNYGSGNTSVTLAGGATITATQAGTTSSVDGVAPATSDAQYGIFAFTYGKGSTLVDLGFQSTITSGSTGINAGNQAIAIAQGSGSTVSVYTQGSISSGTNLHNSSSVSGSAPSAIQAGYIPGLTGAFNSNVYGDVIVNAAAAGTSTITAAAGAGISAYNYAVGDITVTVGSGVTITTSAAAPSWASGGRAPYGVAATNRGSGSILVVTSPGSIINAASNGINAVNDANPGTSTQDLTNLIDYFAGNVTAGKPAVVAVTAAGTITSGSLPTNGNGTPSGIAAGFFGGGGQPNQYVSGNVFINNAAVVNAAGFGLQGYNYGYGNITINVATGGNVTAGSHGIYAHADGAFTDPVSASKLTRDIAVTVYANTTITAGSAAFDTAYGIQASSTNAGSISVVTSAGDTINSQSGSSGITAVNLATSIAPSFNSLVIVTNVAAIHSGDGLTGFGNQPGGIVAGYIGQATSSGSGNPANYNVHGEVLVYNSGNITADAGDGIRAFNYGVGDVYVNNLAGTIVALGGPSPQNGQGVGIVAQNFGPGSVHVTTSASTSITSGSSGISATNRATTADPLNPTVVVPATTEVAVYASGTIRPGTTLTGSGDPPAGILAGFNPNNLNTPNNSVHGNVFVDSHATIVAPLGTDGIRGINYGGPDSNGAGGDIKIVVESDSNVTGGRYGVAALGYNGGDLDVTINGSVFGGGLAAVNATTTGAGVATIDNTGFISGLVTGYNATFTNEASGDWLFSGTSSFTGASSFTNAGTIETSGTSAISGLGSFVNTGLIAVDLGTLTIGAPMTGGGIARLYDGTLVLTGASDVNVQFADINPANGGKLVLWIPFISPVRLRALPLPTRSTLPALRLAASASPMMVVSCMLILRVVRSSCSATTPRTASRSTRMETVARLSDGRD